jgi:two-component system cell cycle sensor histidine kinase PleC
VNGDAIGQETIAGLMRQTPPVAPDTVCAVVLDRFQQRPDEQMIAVVARERPVGLVDRSDFLGEISKTYRFELFGRKPISTFMDRNPVVIDAGDAIEVAYGQIVKRPAAKLPVGLIATHNRGYAGVCSALEIARRMAELTRQQNEALSQARVRLARSSQAKSEFLANISHELRTPLNAIIGFSDVMRAELFGAIGVPRYRAYVDDIHASALHLLGLINDVLDLSKVEAGQLTLDEEPLSIAETADAVMRLVAPQAAASGLKLESEIAADLPPVLADARRLRQILLNLLGNAIKFTPAGGRVRLQAGRRADGGVRCLISDTGVGIAAADMDRILMPFGRGESSYVRSKEGTGLGLSVTKTLVERHDGRLTIDSAVGVGTTVCVDLPAARSLAGDGLRAAS